MSNLIFGQNYFKLVLCLEFKLWFVEFTLKIVVFATVVLRDFILITYMLLTMGPPACMLVSALKCYVFPLESKFLHSKFELKSVSGLVVKVTTIIHKSCYI